MALQQMRTNRISPVLRFLGRLLALVVASVVWLLVLIASALVLLLHLVASALSRATNAAVSLLLAAEAAAHKDVVTAYGEILGRPAEPPAPAAGALRLSEVMRKRWAERKKPAA